MKCWISMIKETFSSDLYIGDYTRYVSNHPSSPYRGVVADVNKLPCIQAFSLHNPDSITFDFVNFEYNPALFKREDGSKASQCECMCEACAEEDVTHWLMLLELKYCNQKNINTNVRKALTQLCKTFEWLTNKPQAIIHKNRHKVYFVISHPEHSITDAFDSFFLEQDKLLEIKEQYGATTLYANKVEIQTIGYLKKK